jgi:hypothetical protein
MPSPGAWTEIDPSKYVLSGRLWKRKETGI